MNQEQFYEALRALDGKFEALKPELELRVCDPEMDVEGYVVVWSTLAARGGPLGRVGKGGTRITPTVSLDEIRMLSRVMTLKNASAGLPLGGAKSGLRADPAAPGFEQKYRRFVSMVKPILQENGGIFGGFGFDIGGRAEHALWACDELKSTRSFTGKPLELGGTDYDREGIAGLGVATAAKSLMEHGGEDPAAATFAVQGLGAMGAAVVRYFSEAGAMLSAIADQRLGGTFLLKHKPSAEFLTAISRQDFALVARLLAETGAEKMALPDILFQKVDILFPCAVQDVLHEANVEQVRARFVVEGANSPCSETARRRMFERGIGLVPDFVANPGGIIAAFVEMSSKISNEENLKTRGKVEEAKRMTRERIGLNVHKMLELASELRVEPALVGRYLALQNMFR